MSKRIRDGELSHLQRVLKWTGMGIGLTGLASIATIKLFGGPLQIINSTSTPALLLLSTLGSAGFSIACYLIPPNEESDFEQEESAPTNSKWRIGSFVGMAISQGAMLAPILSFSSLYYPLALPSAAITTLAVGLISFAVKNQAEETLSFLRPAYFSLLGISATTLIASFFGLIRGNFFSSVELYSSIGLWSIVTIFDTYDTLNQYHRGDSDYLGHSLKFYYNFFNLFLRILEAQMKRRGNFDDDDQDDQN